MADLSDVMNVLAQVITAALYPGGTPTPSQASIAGPIVTIQTGWPNPQQLDAELRQGIVHVNVYPWKQDRNTTRFVEQWKKQSIMPATIAATVNGNTVSLGGIVGPGQNIGVIVGNVGAYVYQTIAGDTLASIAAALATIILEGIEATSTFPAVPAIPGTTSVGASIILPPGGPQIYVRVGGSGTGIKEIRRQERIMMAGVWAGGPDLRDAVATVIDPAISDLHWLMMPDGFKARIYYDGSLLNDSEQKMGIYRRDLLYHVEYATTVTEQEWQIVVTQTDIGPQNFDASQQMPETVIYPQRGNEGEFPCIN